MPRPAKTLTFDGKTLTIREWAVFIGIASNTIRSRIRYGLSIEKVLSSDKLNTGNPNIARYSPTLGRGKQITHDGVTMGVLQWADKLGISH